jgi:hypothetical protein
MSFLEIVAKNYSYWKPGLIALEARHRLAPIEGQKEIARRLKAVQKEEKKEMRKWLKRNRRHKKSIQGWGR